MAKPRLFWLLLSLPVGALAALTRGYPTTHGDPGIFLSVAGRLLVGDRLYRDVFDNKDPLFHYSQAAALWLFGWRGPFLMDIGWLIVAGIGAHVLVRALTGDVVLAVFGQVLYPLLLTGIHYYAGYSETPGLSLMPVFAYVLYQRRPWIAGCTAAAIIFLRASLLPILLLTALGQFLLVPDRRFRRRDLLNLLGSATAGVLFAFLILAIRGEAGAYVTTLWENTKYPAQALHSEHYPAGVRGHLLVVRDATPEPAKYLILAVVLVLVGVGATSKAARTRLARSDLAILTVTTTLATLLILADTAVWDHHLEILAFPTFLGSVLAVACLRTASFDRGVRLLGIGALSAFCILMSLAMNSPSLSNVELWHAAPNTDVSNALYAAARLRTHRSSSVSYFHFGENDEDGQGAFLNASFRLACPRFHQYPHTLPNVLRKTIRCVNAKRPELVAVTPSFRENLPYFHHPAGPRWEWFVRAGKRYLRSSCSLVVSERGVRVYSCGT